ncbi:MAG: ABC transporter substrate-binding protein [Candidatus Binataceae bacterium]
MTRLTLLLLALLALIMPLSTWAAANDPVAEVKAAIAEASPIFADTKLAPADREQQLRAVANEHFDFAYMARSALGTHWKSLTPAQRKELVPVFTDYVMDTYLGTLKDSTVEAASHAVGDKAVYDGTDMASVPSEVHLPQVADPLQVKYMLRKDTDGWRLYDIVVDNVSTMASYRDQFNTTLNNGGYAKLISQLRQKGSGAAG